MSESSSSIDRTKSEQLTPSFKKGPSPTSRSLAKLRANRENAQKSPGPSTAQGKQVASRNATTHALLATGVIPAVDGPDAQAECDRLQHEISTHYEPVNIMERVLVEEIVLGYWHYRRANRCLDARVKVRVTRAKRRLAEPESATPHVMELRDLLGPDTLLASSAGAATVIKTVEGARAAVANQGMLAPEARTALSRHGRKAFVEACLAAVDSSAAEQDAARLLTLFDAELDALRGLHTQLAEQERSDAAAQVVASALPGVFLDRCLRYGGAYRRAADKARDRLERQQAERRGDPVPPTVRVHVDAS
jgi:hypothetical protein